MSTLLDILILASILVLAVLAVRSLKKSGRRCSSGCSGCVRDCFRAVLLHHIGNCHHSKDLAILREE